MALRTRQPCTHLRRQVVRSATLGACHRLGRLEGLCDAEIANEQMVRRPAAAAASSSATSASASSAASIGRQRAQKDVARLEVSVDDAPRMDVRDGGRELRDHQAHLRLRQPPLQLALFGEERREIAAGTQLHRNAQLLLVNKGCEQRRVGD